jgi:cupin fold WbuC family metalloprotein
MIGLENSKLSELFRDAKAAPRRRSHLLLHSGHDDQVQRLVIALCPGTYVRAHRHPDQWEMLVPLRGRADLLFFAPGGELTERIALSSGGTSVVQIPQGQIHCVVVLEDETAVMEVKPGPYRVSDFLDWAPEEGSPEAASFESWAKRAVIGERWSARAPSRGEFDAAN